MFQDANKLVVFGSQLVGVIIVIVGLLTQQAELHSPRPRPPGSKMSDGTGSERKGERFARLWDDPLEDVVAFETASPKQPLPDGTSTRLDPSSSPAAQASTTGKKLLLWNILDARQVPEIKEIRLRTRYAVVSALLTAGYLPERESMLSPLTPSSLAEPNAKNIIGYFETFRKTVDPKPEFFCVTVIWLPKEVLADQKVMESLREQIASRDQDTAAVKEHVLHHGSSEDLARYVASKDKTTDISFTRATIADKYLCPDGTECIQQSLRPITSDDVLVDALLSELSLRIPALNRPSTPLPRIVVFTELDTNYSRAIASQLREKFAGKARLDVYSYLRGLDGRPDNITIAPAADKAKTQDAVSALLQGKAISEISLGTSQFDYLRRLALHLESRVKRRKDRDVVALGILGSDIYDKMLVLQAVQPELPAAIIFTTDLDAIYLERENQPFTRNLVVASADGLDANKKGGGSWQLPPMRDSYQTVLVKFIRELLSHREGQAALNVSAAPAQVFEIAAGKSIDLNLSRDISLKTRTAKFVLQQLSTPTLNSIIFTAALLNAFLVLMAISTRQYCGCPDRPEVGAAPMKPWARTIAYAEIGVAFLGIMYLLYRVGKSDATLLFGEPLALGVSIWPSVMIRLLAFLVAILLLLIASYSFVAYGEGLRKKLQTAVPSTIELPLAEALTKESARLCHDVVLETPSPARLHTFETHLETFFNPRARQKRIVAASIAYLALSIVLFSYWPSTVPARGGFALLSEKIVLSLGVSLYIIHLIFCLDLHLSAYTLLRTLRSFYSPAVQREMKTKKARIDSKEMLCATSTLTSLIGKTLLYPLTVLILIILSRLRIFDNWVMTPSLTVTFSFGAILLVAASLVLWLEGARLKSAVLATRQAEREMGAKQREELEQITGGVFAAWHHQPIFAAIFSAAAVFGSLSVAGPLARLFFGSS